MSGAATETPPPVPIKTRRSTASQHYSITSPATTPTHSLGSSHGNVFSPSHEYADGGRVPLPHGATPTGAKPTGELPPVPLRMESIAFVKTMINQEAPPPKPPRNDRPNSAEMVSGNKF